MANRKRETINSHFGVERKFKTTFFKLGREHEVVVNVYEYIGLQVAKIQREKKITNDELAKLCRFANGSSISRIKKGKHSYQVDTIYRLCLGLKCESADLLPF